MAWYHSGRCDCPIGCCYCSDPPPSFEYWGYNIVQDKIEIFVSEEKKIGGRNLFLWQNVIFGIGVGMPRLNQTNFNIEAAKKLYDAGLGYDKIGLTLGVSKPSLKRLFMHRGWHKGDRGRVLNCEADRTRLARNVMRDFK